MVYSLELTRLNLLQFSAAHTHTHTPQDQVIISGLFDCLLWGLHPGGAYCIPSAVTLKPVTKRVVLRGNVAKIQQIGLQRGIMT